MAMNLVVLRGECAGAPEVRELARGRRLASLSVRVWAEGVRTSSVPVTVWEPATWIEDLPDGAKIVVVGTVRRRFFRTAAGSPGTRVDVEAAYVGRGGQRRQLAAALKRAEDALEELMT